MSSDLFTIGASGTKAYRASLAAISENISNASTEGYSRRTVSTRESAVSAAAMIYYKGQATFGGVEIASVNRANDPYLDASARLTGQQLNSSNARLRWMTDIETALNDGDRGVGHLMSDLYSSITQLAANPSDTSRRSNVLFGVEQVVNAFNQSAQDLSAVQTGIASSADREVSLLNDALTEIARVNGALLRSKPGTSNEAQLLDSRDLALTQITQRVDATVTFGPNGTAAITYNGASVVDGATAGKFTVAADATTGTLTLSLNGTATTNPASGSLGGLFTSATTTHDRITSLDAVANTFATNLNTWHSQGLTDANAAGGALVSGTTAATLTQALTNISGIAAKSSDGTLNGNLANIASIRGTGGAEQAWTALVTAHANLLATTTAEQTATETRDTQARSARDDVSGIDLDMEAADLLRIQQAYSGCAKIIQVARETVDAILNIM